MDWKKFDEKVDLEGLKKDVEEAGTTDYEEVEHGKYEVSIEKLELTESKKGDPMLSIWFKIRAGKYENSMLFMNQVMTQGFQIHICNEFLRSLKCGEVEFESFEQFAEMCDDLFNTSTAKGYTYELDYGENKGYNTFKINKVFAPEN